MNWMKPSDPSPTGNTHRFVAAGAVVVTGAGNTVDEVDFTNVFSGAAWIFTTIDPIPFTTATRNDPV